MQTVILSDLMNLDCPWLPTAWMDFWGLWQVSLRGWITQRIMGLIILFPWLRIPRFFQLIWFRPLRLHQSIWMYQSHLPRQKLRVEKPCVTQLSDCGTSPCAKICDPLCRMDCARSFYGLISMARKLMSLTAVKSTRFSTSTH